MSRRTVLMTMALTAAAASGASAFQQTLEPGREPGHPSPSAVWINNRAASEAIPVRLFGDAEVTLSQTAAINTRSVRQAWEYASVTLVPDQNVGSALLTQGLDGWEAIGIAPAGNGRVLVLLKRPAR